MVRDGDGENWRRERRGRNVNEKNKGGRNGLRGGEARDTDAEGVTGRGTGKQTGRQKHVQSV